MDAARNQLDNDIFLSITMTILEKHSSTLSRTNAFANKAIDLILHVSAFATILEQGACLTSTCRCTQALSFAAGSSSNFLGTIQTAVSALAVRVAMMHAVCASLNLTTTRTFGMYTAEVRTRQRTSRDAISKHNCTGMTCELMGLCPAINGVFSINTCATCKFVVQYHDDEDITEPSLRVSFTSCFLTPTSRDD